MKTFISFIIFILSIVFMILILSVCNGSNYSDDIIGLGDDKAEEIKAQEAEDDDDSPRIIYVYLDNTSDDTTDDETDDTVVIDHSETLVITDFNAVEGENNRQIVLTWNNPVESTFSSVLLLRRSDEFPSAYDDEDAATLHSGAYEKYTDSELTPSATYYYTIFAKDSSGTYYNPRYAYKAVTETTLDIRKRSFFLIGGSSSYGSPTTNLISAVDMFDPLTETMYASVATLPNPRVFCDIASVDGKIYVFGGKDNSGVVDDVDILDISDLSWTSGAVMPSPRCALRTVVYEDKIYCLGGSTTTVPSGAQASNYIYDTINDTWTNDTNIFQDLNTAKCAFSAVSYSGMIFYYGGVAGANGLWSNSGGYYDINSNQRTDWGSINYAYYKGATSSFYYKEYDTGEILAFFIIIGGSNDNTNNVSENVLPVNTITLTYNYVQAAFIPNVTGSTPNIYYIYPQDGANTGIQDYTNRVYAGCEYYGEYIYYFGGIGAGSLALTTIERLDVNSGNLRGATWTNLSVTLNTARYGFGITRVNY